MLLAAQFSAISTRQRVDRAAGVIHGVSVITEGEASGHGLFIDGTTLKQVMETATAYQGGLKVKVNHGTGLESIAGRLKDFVIDGKNVRANLHLLDASEDRAKVLEMADTMPESFGISITFANTPEEIEGKKFARCVEIYSADLVDSPAANPSGLFSKPKEHQQNKTMTKEVLVALGLPETATDTEFASELKKRFEAVKPPDLSAVTALAAKVTAAETQLEATKTELASLTKSRDTALSLAKKGEIDALLAEASRDGKVVPFENDDLYTIKDGVITILQQPTQLAKVIAKLRKGELALSKKSAAAIIDADGKTFDRHTPEGKSKLEQFCRQRRSENEIRLTEIIHAQTRQN